jgi:hypothetical protein
LKGSKTREEEEPRERAKGKKTKLKERREKLRRDLLLCIYRRVFSLSSLLLFSFTLFNHLYNRQTHTKTRKTSYSIGHSHTLTLALFGKH